MYYVVKVQKVIPREADANGYIREDSVDIYAQSVDDLDINAIIQAVNMVPTAKK